MCQSVQGFRFYRGSNFPFITLKSDVDIVKVQWGSAACNSCNNVLHSGGNRPYPEARSVRFTLDIMYAAHTTCSGNSIVVEITMSNHAVETVSVRSRGKTASIRAIILSTLNHGPTMLHNGRAARK